MALLDALLPEPPRLNIWVARRDDGILGTGTQMDPYDGSTEDRFDALMNRLPGNTCVRLGPGTFPTRGYAEDITGNPVPGGWELKSGLRIVGAGIDVTTVRIVNTAVDVRRVYAMGHPLTAPKLADYFEVCDLTIDCNLEGVGAAAAAGAVRVLGNHARLARVKAIHWGIRGGTRSMFVLAALTADPASGIVGVTHPGIVDCIATDPGAASTGPVTVLHVGGRESAVGNQQAMGMGIGGYIRNCYIDGGQVSDFSTDFRALSIAWSRGGVVEGNQVHNVRHGGPHQTALGALDLIVRNNVYRNVYKGPYWNLPANGVQRLLVEGNSIELAASAPATEYGIELGSSALPPFHAHGSIVIRNNLIRYVDGLPGNGNGIRVASARNLMVRENVLDLAPAQPRFPINNAHCDAVEYSENRTPSGRLLRGYHDTGSESTASSYNELETETEEALLLGMFRRR